VSVWNVTGRVTTREAHLRRARYAARMVRETQGATRQVWREHARQHVKAARREHWLIVAQRRAMSAGMFLRKTAGFHLRAH
jgi:hypothetical protein